MGAAPYFLPNYNESSYGERSSLKDEQIPFAKCKKQDPQILPLILPKGLLHNEEVKGLTCLNQM